MKLSLSTKERDQLVTTLEALTLRRSVFTGVASLSATSVMLGHVYISGGIATAFFACGALNAALNIIKTLFGIYLFSSPGSFEKRPFASAYRHMTHFINLLWCGLAYGTYEKFGTTGQPSVLVLLITCAMIASAEFAYLTMLDLSLATMLVLGLGTTISIASLASTPFDYAVSSLGVVFAAFMSFNAWQTYLVMFRSEKDRMDKTDKNALMLSMMNATPGFMTLIDAENLVYVMVNDDFQRAIGREIVGHEVGSIEHDHEFYDLLSEFRASGNFKVIKDVELGRGTHRKPYLVSMSKVVGRRPMIAVLSIDISEQKKTEMALAKARSDAEHSGRLAALGEMISGLAHEIRNPLTIISARAMNLPILAAKEPLNPERSKVEGQKIAEMVDRISKIIGTVLKFSRGESDAAMAPVRLSAVIDEVRMLTDIKCKTSGVEMRTSIPESVVEFECQQLQFSQVLINLVNNAVDAIEKYESKWIEIRARLVNEKVEFRVVDCGPGIPEETREKMLQPFFTTKPAGKGTGLGLSISRSIVEKHAGKLWIDGEAPNTTFVIELPVRQAGIKISDKAS